MPSPYDNLRFSQSQFIPQYHGAPVEEFKNLLQKRETNYDQNLAAFDQIELAASDLDVNDADYIVKKEALDKVRGQIQNIADSDGAYEFAGSQVRQVAKEFTGNEALKAAVSNQALIKAKKEEYQKLYLDDDMSKIGRDKAFQLLGEYKGVGKSEEGIYDTPELYNPIKYTDVGEKLTAFGKGFKADKISEGWRQTADGRWFDKVTDTYLGADQVEAAMREYAQSSPDIMATVNEHQTITGEDMLSGLIKAEGIKLGFQERDFDRITNQYQLAAEKASMADRVIGGLPIGIITSVPGYGINSTAQVGERRGELAKAKDEIRREMTTGFDSKTEVEKSKLKVNYEAIEVQEEALAYMEDQIDRQAFKNAKTNGLIPQTSTFETYTPTDVLMTPEEFEEKHKSSTSSNPLVYQGMQSKESYAAYVVENDPVLAEKERLWIEASKRATIETNVVPVMDKKSRDMYQRSLDSIGGTVKENKKGIKEKGADAFGVGMQWFGSTKAGENVDDNTYSNFQNLVYVGSAQDPATGNPVIVSRLNTTEGFAGYIMIGGKATAKYLAETGQVNYSVYMMGAELATVDKLGIKTVNLGSGASAKVVSNLHNPTETEYLYEITFSELQTDGSIKERTEGYNSRETAQLALSNAAIIEQQSSEVK